MEAKVRVGLLDMEKEKKQEFLILLLLIVIPAFSIVAFLLPAQIQDALRMKSDTPNPLTFITSVFVHANAEHLLVNIVMFVMVGGLLYSTNKKAKKIKFLLQSLLLIVIFLPLLYGVFFLLLNNLYLHLSFVSCGLSLLVAGLIGLIPPSLIAFIHGMATPGINRHKFLISMISLTAPAMMLPYIGLQPYNVIIFFPLIIMGLFLIVGEYQKLMRFAREGNKKDKRKVVVIILVLTFYFILILLLFPTKIIQPSGGIVNIIAHFFGLFFGLLSGQFLSEKHITTQCYLVEVYGSLLSSRERKKILSKGGVMEEVGYIKRNGWKISFDRYSNTHAEAALNFVKTGNEEDLYYTKVYKMNKRAFDELMNREMGPQTSKKWKQKKPISHNSYRPVRLASELGETYIFLIPNEGRKPTPTNNGSNYVNIVKEGIIESFKGEKRERNLNALHEAIAESKKHRGNQ